MSAALGIVEGYYGRPWSWEARASVTSFLAPHGYSFYIYAPKADSYLRKRWREPYPAEMSSPLRQLGAHCRSLGIRFGVGLSPYEIYRAFDATARNELKAKLAALGHLGIDSLAILVDAMRGGHPK